MARRFVKLANNTPVVGWVFMFVWMSVVAMVTGLAVAQGFRSEPPTPVEVALLLLFWAFGLGGCAWFLGMPRTLVTIDNGWVVARQAWLFKRQEERFAARQSRDPLVVRRENDGGDPYFRLQLITPSGREMTVAEHHLESEVQAAHDRLAEAMGRKPSAWPTA